VAIPILHNKKSSVGTIHEWPRPHRSSEKKQGVRCQVRIARHWAARITRPVGQGKHGKQPALQDSRNLISRRNEVLQEDLPLTSTRAGRVGFVVRQHRAVRRGWIGTVAWQRNPISTSAGWTVSLMVNARFNGKPVVARGERLLLLAFVLLFSESRRGIGRVGIRQR
jgi:hypothetical protein